MDQIKIGKFISEMRKEQNLTQRQLADSLSISDKTVSKWDRGKGLPEVSLMMPLCDILGISVNELLNGEKIVMENNERKNDQLLLKMAKELEEKNKTIWRTMWVIMIVSITALLAGIFLTAFLIPEGPWQLVSMLGICIVFMIPCFYAVKLEVSVGAYKCKNCGNEFVPTYKEVMMAMHRGFTRHLVCPECGKRTWCKKVWKK